MSVGANYGALEVRMSDRDRIRAIRFTLVEQAISKWPREACGMVLCRAGETMAWLLPNVSEDADRFEACPRDLYELEQRLEQPEYLLVATWHSHPRSGPWMSAADYEHALGRQEVEHVIVGRTSANADWSERIHPSAAAEWAVRSYRVRPGSLQFWEVPA